MNIKDIFLETENYILRPLILEDLEGNYKYWLNKQKIVEYSTHGRFPQTVVTLRNYIENTINAKNQIVLAVVDRVNLQHIGNIGLQNINWIDSNAEIAFLLGEEQYWGKGVMYEVALTLINHAFTSLNLHRVYCGTSSNHLSMQKLAIKLGMCKEGVRKEALFFNGQYFDEIEYGIVNDKNL